MTPHAAIDLLREWQFQIDGRPAAPPRETKQEAFADAVRLGYASWRKRGGIYMDATAGGEIVRLT